MAKGRLALVRVAKASTVRIFVLTWPRAPSTVCEKMGTLLNLFAGSREYEAYSILGATLPANRHLFTKVRLADVIDIEDTRLEQRDKDFALKASFDLLITDENYWPVHAVELQGIYHQFEPQISRDIRKRRICHIAGLRLTEIACSSSEIRQELLARVVSVEGHAPKLAERDAPTTTMRTCPDCGCTYPDSWWTLLEECLVCGKDLLLYDFP